MLSKAFQNCSKIFFRCSQHSRDVWQDTETLFYPKNPVQFINGKCVLYQSDIFTRLRNYYFIVSAVTLSVLYFSGKKLYNYSERKWYGLIFYAGLFGITLKSLRSGQQQYQRLIIQLDLLPCGRQISVLYPSLYGTCTNAKYDISTISRPKDAYQKSIHEMSHVFPVIIDSNLFYLHRDPDFIVNKEILPAVMNAKYIKVN